MQLRQAQASQSETRDAEYHLRRALEHVRRVRMAVREMGDE